MSTISAGTTTTTALVSTGDTTGNLVLATGSVPTTALTLNSTTQAATFAGAVNFASWTTATRPSSPAVGQMGYNTTTGKFDQYTAAGWTSISTQTTGQVLQVVNATYGTIVTTSSATFTSTGLTASITPTSATSKILVLVSQNGVGKSTGDMTVQIKLQRNSSDILVLSGQAAYTQSGAYNNIGSVSGEYLDSPATTSSVTYRTVFAAYSPVPLAFVQSDVGIQSVSTITLIEIAA